MRKKLIDKDALLLEIDRQKIGYNVDGKHSVEYNVTRKIIDVINSLEMKEVDLDLENDIKNAFKACYELGIQQKTQKGK